MTFPPRSFLTCAVIALMLCGCGETEPEPARRIDYLLVGGSVFIGGRNGKLENVDVGVADGRIVFVGDARARGLEADNIFDASGLVVAPGFIDPHTHALSELQSATQNSNLNYLTQGVTTVFIGNDGGGPVDVAGRMDELTANGIGTNVAMYIGLGRLREDVMSGENRAPTAGELERMKGHVRDAMDSGAIGFSTGLYYAPDNFATTDEVIELAKVAAGYGGIYDTHIRDESTYNIGLLGAVEEALQIGREAGIHLHLAHIKALGVDVWGESAAVIEMVERARNEGQRVTADQYPWSASGTHLRNTLLPRYVLAGTDNEYLERLRDVALLARIRPEMQENLRRRGGPASLLIVVSNDRSLQGKTLADIAAERNRDPVDVAVDVMLLGPTRVASFNMNQDDIDAFMQRKWVMTSSDGTDGHPRKFASFPKKYRDYVVDRKLLTKESFIYRSSGLAAETFGLGKRGRIEEGYIADIIAFDPDEFGPAATFAAWNQLTQGVVYALVNGTAVLVDGEYTGQLPGVVIKRDHNE